MAGKESILQAKLVDELVKSGMIRTPLVEQAFRTVSRRIFLPGEPLERVYSDQAIAVKRDAEGNWISSSSQPAIMALMLEQLDLRPGQSVLEVGAGSGFNAALIASIVEPEGTVVSVDIQEDVVADARKHLNEAGYEWVQTIYGDGGSGYLPESPYDRIIVTASSSMIPPAWREQLTESGLLVLPLDIGAGLQKCVAFQRQGEILVSQSVVDAGFMPLQGDYAAAQPRKSQLGADPRLYISSYQDVPVDSEVLNNWFRRPQDIQPAGMRVSLKDLLVSFTTWLTVQGLGWAQLNALEELAEQDLFPTILKLSGDRLSSSTLAWIGSDSMAVVCRAPGQDTPFREIGRIGEDFNNPFDLYLRAYGPGKDALIQLVELLRRWDQDGRPPADRLQFRAIPNGRSYNLREGEHLLRRPWTDITAWYA